MADENMQLAGDITDIIRESVKTTVATLFNVSIDSCVNGHKVPTGDDIVCCGELTQGNATAKLFFLFDRELIEILMQCAFSLGELNDPAIYESAALEIANIVSSNLKTYLNVHGYELQMNIPYMVDRSKIASGENPMVQLAFFLKDSNVMGVDFYLRRAS